MNESRYLQLFSDGSDALLRLIGLDQAYLATGSAGSRSRPTSCTGRGARRRASRGDEQMLAADEKRMHLFQTATRSGRGRGRHRRADAAACRHARRARLPAEPAMRERLCASRRPRPAARPADAGRHVGERRADEFALTPEQEMVVATVRGFVENELYPLEAEVERTGEVPAEVGREIAQRCRSWLLRAQHPGGVRRRRARPPDLHAARARARPGVLCAVRVLGAAVQHPLRLQRGARERYLLPRCAARRSTASP